MHMWYYYVVKKVGFRYSVDQDTVDLDLTTHYNSKSSDCCL